MKKILIILVILMSLGLLGCSSDETGGGETILKEKDIFGIYTGTGKVTKEEVERKQSDIDNGRYVFVLGEEGNTKGELINIVFEFDEEEDGIWFTNKDSGLNGKLAYQSSSGQWEGKVDYPIGTLIWSADFYREGDSINAIMIFTQSFEKETFENPEPSDGVNEVTMELKKVK